MKRYLNIGLLIIGISFNTKSQTINFFYDSSDRLDETHNKDCFYTLYSYDQDGNRIKKEIVIIEVAIISEVAHCDIDNGVLEAISDPSKNFSYKWSNGKSGSKLINLKEGKYTLTITDESDIYKYSCTRDAEVKRIPNPITEAKITPQGGFSFCEGSVDSLKASYQLGNEYNWYRNGVIVQTGFDSIYKATQGGNYSVEIMNSGCSKTSSTITLNLLPKPQPNITSSKNPIVCYGDSILLSSSITGKSYKWSSGETTKSINIKALNTGAYTLTLTENNGCIGISPKLDLRVNPLPVFTIISGINPPVFCENLITQLSPTINGAKYEWSNNQKTKTINVSSTGKYTLTLTDANLCTNTSSIDVIVNKLPNVVANTSSNEVCLGDNLTLYGSGALTYTWDNGVLDNKVFKPSNSRRYIVMGKDVNACEDTASIYVPVNELPEISVNTYDIKCYGKNDGEIHISVQKGHPPYQFSINSNTYQSSPDFINLAKGIYSVSAKDNKACKSNVYSSQVLENVSEFKAKVVKEDVKCYGYNDGKITIISTGGTAPYSYSLDTSAFTQSPVFANVNPGSHEVVIKDNNGCIINQKLNIIEPLKLTSSIDRINPDDCFPSGTGSVNVKATGGTGSITYSINNGMSFQGTGQFNGIISGNYKVISKDVNNCVHELPLLIPQTIPMDNFKITLQNDKLISPYADPNKWYEVGNPNSIGNGKEFVCTHGSTYYVVGIDINGCESRSEVLLHPCLTGANDLNNDVVFRVYPNPTNGILKIEVSNLKDGDYVLSLITMTGSEVYSSKIITKSGRFETEIDINYFPAGNYFVKLIEHSIEIKNLIFKK